MDHHHPVAFRPQESTRGIMICLLGEFRLLKDGHPVASRGGHKVEALLSTLAVRPNHRASREILLYSLWPDSEPNSASKRLNSLLYTVHQLLASETGGVPLVSHCDGFYELNTRAGITTDVACFETLAMRGAHFVAAGDKGTAEAMYLAALDLYRGDLLVDGEASIVVERERLRILYLSLLTWLAEYAFARGEYSRCLDYTMRLLSHEPCREDAHRLAMRCYMWRGERAHALRQYRLCQRLLRQEFDAEPEPETTELFDQIRSNSRGD